MISLQISTHSLQICTCGPAINVLTSSCAFSQNEHRIVTFRPRLFFGPGICRITGLSSLTSPASMSILSHSFAVPNVFDPTLSDPITNYDTRCREYKICCYWHTLDTSGREAR